MKKSADKAAAYYVSIYYDRQNGRNLKIKFRREMTESMDIAFTISAEMKILSHYNFSCFKSIEDDFLDELLTREF